jgi:tRNA(Ile)-lysidine synthase
MRSTFEQNVLQKIRSERSLPAGSRIAVAVSGGADSVALLRLLDSLKGELGIVLVVAHFNHSLRGAESDADETFVEQLARGLGIVFVSSKQDVRAESERNHWNLEDAGRRLRKAFFQRIVRDGEATRVALAHTADDQAETVLAQIIRGTGIKGLGGIYPGTASIVRPLLQVRREALREYLREIGQEWREDSSNADTGRLRARIRERLIPLLQTDFSSSITEHLNTLARLAREENEFWDALVESRYEALVGAAQQSLKIETRALLEPLSAPIVASIRQVSGNGNGVSPFRTLTERMIRRLYEGVRGDLKELTAAHVEQVIRLAKDGTSRSRVELPDGIAAEKVLDSIVFSRSGGLASAAARGTQAAATSYQYRVERPYDGSTTVSVPELGTAFRLKVIDWLQTESDTKRDTVALDAELVHFPLILRNWRPGDAYRPKGHRDERKLKQLLLATRVPVAQRASWPVIESDGRIIWAHRMPPSADFLVSSATRVGLMIEDADFPDVQGI